MLAFGLSRHAALLAFLLIFFLVFCAHWAQAQDGSIECPTVNCDCQSITVKAWVEGCKEREQFIKHACKINHGVPRHYCGLHGPQAKPLAIETQLPAVPPISEELLLRHQQQLDLIIPAIFRHLDAIREQEQKGNIYEAVYRQRVLSHTIEHMLTLQVRTAEGVRKTQGQDIAKTLWRQHIDSLENLAHRLDSYGEEVWVKVQNTMQPKQRQAYRVLAMHLFKNASQVADHQAMAEEAANHYLGAANAWLFSARLTQRVLSKEFASTNNAGRIKDYTEKSIARWNRASHYWGKAITQEDASGPLLKVDVQTRVETIDAGIGK